MRFVFLLVHNYDWYLWAHRAFKRSCIWRWLWDASHQTADTAKQAFQTSCLLSPSLLNHHHSSQLYDSSRDISSVRVAACASPADSDDESGREPSLVSTDAVVVTLFVPVIKLSLPCCCVKRQLCCLLCLGEVSLGSFLNVMLFSWTFSSSIRSKQLVRLKKWCISALRSNVPRPKIICLHVYRLNKLATGYT